MGYEVVDAVFDLNPIFLHVILKPLEYGIKGRMFYKLADGNVVGFCLGFGKGHQHQYHGQDKGYFFHHRLLYTK